MSALNIDDYQRCDYCWGKADVQCNQCGEYYCYIERGISAHHCAHYPGNTFRKLIN